MKLRETILAEHSKAQCNKIVKWVGSNQDRFDQLFYLLLHDEYKVVQRAASPVSYCVESHPLLNNNHFTNLIRNLKKSGIHDAVKRNSIRFYNM